MRTTRGKGRRLIGRSLAEKKASFRDLKAFGMWRNRADLEDPVQFTNELRARMERPDRPINSLCQFLALRRSGVC